MKALLFLVALLVAGAFAEERPWFKEQLEDETSIEQLDDENSITTGENNDIFRPEVDSIVVAANGVMPSRAPIRSELEREAPKNVLPNLSDEKEVVDVEDLSTDTNMTVDDSDSPSSSLSRTPSITASVSPSSSPPPCLSMTYKNEHSVSTMVFGDYASTSEAQGRLLVGGDASLVSVGISDKLKQTSGHGDALIVKGNLNFKSGRVHAGNIVWGESQEIDTSVKNGLGRNRIIHNPNRFNFTAAQDYFENMSRDVSRYQLTGGNTFDPNSNTLSLEASGSHDPEVFMISCSNLAQAVSVQMNGLRKIHTPTVVVNVRGKKNCAFSNGLDVGAIGNSRKIMWNFFQTEHIEIANVAVEGSILAPYADIISSFGDVYGQTVAFSWNGAAVQNYNVFKGCVRGPVTPSPTASFTPSPSPTSPSTSTSPSMTALPVKFSEDFRGGKFLATWSKQNYRVGEDSWFNHIQSGGTSDTPLLLTTNDNSTTLECVGRTGIIASPLFRVPREGTMSLKVGGSAASFFGDPNAVLNTDICSVNLEVMKDNSQQKWQLAATATGLGSEAMKEYTWSLKDYAAWIARVRIIDTGMCHLSVYDMRVDGQPLLSESPAPVLVSKSEEEDDDLVGDLKRNKNHRHHHHGKRDGSLQV